MGLFKSVKETLIHRFGRLSERGSYAVICVTALMVLLGGIWVAKESGKNTDLQMRRDLVRQATAIAAAVNPLNLRALSFTADDKNRPEFQRLSSQLRAYAEVAHIKSLYTMALRNGKIVFGPESLVEGHPYASPPGTVYEEPSQKDFDIFVTGSPQIQGPHSDEYGMFVTASVPVFDPRSGEVLVVVGIDVESSVWRIEVRKAQWVPALITLLLLFILFLAGLTLKFRHQHRPQRNERKRHAEPVLCFVFLILLTLILVVAFDRAERVARKESFHQMAQKYASTCAEEFYDIRESIDQLSCFFVSSQCVNHDEFGAYCGYLVEHGVLQSCVWIPAVPDADAGAFIQAVRMAGQPDFTIWQKNSAGYNEPAEGRPVYYPALYIEPQAGHEKGFGYDLNSEPVRSAAIQEALRTGLATATDPIHLIALTNSPPGIFIFKSVNASFQKGLAAFVIRPENLLGGVHFKNKKNYGLKVCLIQLRPGAEPLFVAGSDSSCDLSCFDEADPSLRVMIPIFRFGKAYVMNLIPDVSWQAANPLRHGRLAGIFGLLVTVLITTLVSLITNRRAALERLVVQRTEELESSERHIRTVLETLPDLVWLKDLNGVYLSCNSRFESLFGASQKEICGKTDYDFVSRELANSFRRHDLVAIKAGGPVTNEEEVTFADGHRELLETIKTPLSGRNGDLIGVLGIGRDITARKKAMEQIEFQAQILDQIKDMITVTDVQGRISYVNDAVCWKLGRSREEILTQSVENYGDDVTQREIIRQTLAFGEWRGEVINHTSDGRKLTLDCRTWLWRDANGDPVYMVGISTDITDRKAAEQQLAHRAELLAASALISRKIFEIENLQDSIESILTILGTVTEQDRAYIFECHEDSDGGKLISQRYEWCRTGIEPQIGNPAMQNISLARNFSRWNQILQSGQPVKGSTAGFPADERAILDAQNILSLLVMPVFVENAFWGFIGLDNCHVEYEWDASEISILSGAADLIALAIIRKRTIESLANAQSRLRLAFEVAQMGHWRYDCKTGAVQWFEGHEKLYGISPEAFKGTLAAVQEMIHPDDRLQWDENLRRTVEENVPFDDTYRVIHPDRSLHWLHSYGHLYCDAHGRPDYVFGVTQEITGFKNAEAELKQRCDELELFHDVTVGRELRMIELKKEINALLKTIGQPEKYIIVGEDE